MKMTDVPIRSYSHGGERTLSRESSRYHSELPDFEERPNVYSRNWKLLEWVGIGKRVLELGCSTGYLSEYMTRKRDCVVTAIEIDQAAAERAARVCNKVLVRDLNCSNWLAGLPQKSFDVVLMGDVLEHLLDGRTVLLQVRELLDQDAKLVICLPNVVHWITRLKILSGRFDYESAGTLDHTHLRFYTPKSARALIEGAGYRITRFHPVFGGRLSGHARPIWRWLTKGFPGLFALQMLFEAEDNRASN